MAGDEPAAAAELIREARADARAAVKARLRARFERELEDEVARLLDPPPAVDGDGLWVYCVARDGHPGAPGDVAGVAGGEAPRVVAAAGLRALVSPVPLSEFGEDGLKRNLNDLGWLEAMARAHESVLDAALARGAIVPLRVCTIYRGEEQVREQLAARRPAFAEALEWLDGRAEWGVKVIAAADRAERLTRAAERDAPATGGSEYLARRQQERQVRAQADTFLDEAVRECHARLEEWAAASQLLPPQSRELAGYEGEMVLNGAYLVDDERRERFEAVVAQLGEQYAADGLSFRLSGPWPAYHFVGRLETLGEPAP